MKTAFALLALLVSFNAFAVSENTMYPIGPNPALTPGSLCDRAESRRYPEQIKYCGRHVEPETKRMIFQMYDRQLGYNVTRMNRGDFKIDHYIPLCAGGSNNVNNLWPQHSSVYEITDPMEALICEKMADGALSQSQAVALIRKAKNDLSQVPVIMGALERL